MAELDNVTTGVRDTPWAGHQVRVQVHGSAVYLEPADAAQLAQDITAAAAEAINADRAARRG